MRQDEARYRKMTQDESPRYVICHMLVKEMADPKPEGRSAKIFAKVIVVGDTG